MADLTSQQKINEYLKLHPPTSNNNSTMSRYDPSAISTHHRTNVRYNQNLRKYHVAACPTCSRLLEKRPGTHIINCSTCGKKINTAKNIHKELSKRNNAVKDPSRLSKTHKRHRRNGTKRHK